MIARADHRAGLEEARLDPQRRRSSPTSPRRPARGRDSGARPGCAAVPLARAPPPAHRQSRWSVVASTDSKPGDSDASISYPSCTSPGWEALTCQESRGCSAAERRARRPGAGERRPLDDERHPLTAPAVRPDTIWRWKNMNTISGGIVISRTSANSRLPVRVELALEVEQRQLDGGVLGARAGSRAG